MSSIWDVRRSRTDAKLAGLCGGVAEHWGIDPVLVRVGCVLLALSGGVGIVLYAAGWLLVPRAGRPTAPLDDLLGSGTPRWPREVWVILVVVACVAAFSVFGTLTPFGVGPALVLACIWYFGVYRGRQRRFSSTPAPTTPPRPVEQAGPVTPFTEAAEVWRRRIAEHLEQSSPAGVARPPQPASPATAARVATTPLVSTPTWPTLPAQPTGFADADPDELGQAAFLAEPDPVGLYDAPVAAASGASPVLPRRGADRLSAHRLRLVGVAVLGLALGGLGLADRAGAPVTATVYAATALLVVGLTLVAATWFGRARGLLPVGLLLVPVVLATSVAGPLAHLDQWDDLHRIYVMAAELPAAGDDLAGGQLVVDLTGFRPKTDASYTAHVGTGHLQVEAPVWANVVVDYRVGLGAVVVDDQQVVGGSDQAGTTTLPGATPGAPTVVLHLSVDRGQLEVTR